MKFGTIGAGAVALAFAREALARGHEVVLSSRRGPDALADKVAELGRGASAASVEEAASLEYVLLAVPWRNVESALKGLPAWNGRVLIDATNPFVETSPKFRSEAQKLRKGWKELPARVFSNENGNLPDPDNFRCSFFSASSRDDGGAHHPSRSDGLFLSLPGAPHQ